MILSGELAPGERVTEQGLAQQLPISRTPYRVERRLRCAGVRGAFMNTPALCCKEVGDSSALASTGSLAPGQLGSLMK